MYNYKAKQIESSLSDIIRQGETKELGEFYRKKAEFYKLMSEFLIKISEDETAYKENKVLDQ